MQKGGGSKGNKSVMGKYPHKSVLGRKGSSMIGGKGKSATHGSGNKGRKKMMM